MSASPRRRVYALRRSYTGEDAQAAKAGVGRGKAGLVQFNSQQRRFRALLALSLLNYDSGGHQHPTVSVYNASTFLTYSMIVSPRFDKLVFIVPSATENTVGRLLAAPGYPENGVPGLRVAATGKAAGKAFGQCFHLLHLPTGARAVITASSNFDALSGPGGEVVDDYPGPETPLADVERDALSGVPAMTDEIETMVAALVSYLNIRDPQGRWATGMWSWDPLKRAERGGLAGSTERFSRLWGAGRAWELSWNGYPYPEDLLACFTSPLVGIPGVSVVHEADRWQIRLGSSSLRLSYGGICPRAHQRKILHETLNARGHGS
ncbi:hypothetical protein ACPESR_12045 [Nocardia testacea]|uniref:hypothetical protein n=1 Tax=Nocardia testacea TaxID=248551 RepID=UPI003C2B1561